MVILVVVVAVVVVCGLAAWGLRRKGNDEVHSVDGYRSTLHTLEELRAKPQGAVRVGQGDGDPGSEVEGVGLGLPAAESVPVAHSFRPGSSVRIQRDHEPAHESGNEHRDSVGGVTKAPSPSGDAKAVPLIFSDGSLSHPEAIPTRRARHGDRAMSAMNHPPRHWGAPLAAIVVVLLLVGVLLVAGSHHHGPGHSGGSSSPTTSHSATSGSGTHHSGSHHTATSVTAPPTTVPSQLLPSAGSTANEATYVAPSANFTLVVSVASGACWVEAQDVATGHTLLAMTITTGGQQTISATGALTVLLGAPSAATVTLNAKPVTLPPGAVSPFTLSFQPPTSAT